ncbi:MAG: type II secretion system F family protein [Planctomycetes bacterium]|nr:type II secretion system F family protein [Planctomycetota bacterium]
MPHYKYQIQSKDGQMSMGVLAAENAVAAANNLRAQGHRVLGLVPIESAATSVMDKLKALNYSSGPAPKDILNFTTQLAVMIRAGISIRVAIEGIAEQTENAKFKDILVQIKRDVESGKPFSDALAKHPKQFNSLYINMVRASEMSGSFAKMLDRIASYMGQQIETRAMVRGAMIYPCVIFVMAIATTFFLLTFVLPKFAMVFKGKESVLPWPTIFLMGLSDFMVQYWYLVLLGMVAMLAGGIVFIRTEVGAFWWHKTQLTMPLMNRLFKALYISRSLHTMGELVNAGVPMLDTLAITGDISGNSLFRRLWRAVYASVKQGKKISHTLMKAPLLPKSVTQMIAAGEESGKLGEVLDEISEYYAKQLRETIKTVTGLIEPIMILAMGTIVGFIAMAIILPIFKLSSLVK